MNLIARVYRGHDHYLGHDSPRPIVGAHGDSVQDIALFNTHGHELKLNTQFTRRLAWAPHRLGIFLSVHPRREPRVQGKNSLRVPPAFLAGWSSGPYLRVHLRPGPSSSLRHYLGHRLMCFVLGLRLTFAITLVTGLGASLCVRYVSPQTQPKLSPLLRRGVRGAA